MRRYFGEKNRPGGYGVGKVIDVRPRHTAREGIFPYAPDREAVAKKEQLLEKMRERAGLTSPETEKAEKQPEAISLGNIELPSYKKKQEIIEAVTANQVTVVVGPTGSGKSTQVPQFLLEAGFDHVALTQPRIIAADGVGERIADELEQSLGPEARSLVAIQTSERFDHQEQARIFVRTDGLEQVLQLERYLARVPEDAVQEIASKIVLILDEVHESNVNQVGLLALTKDILRTYPGVRIVVMSATAHTEKYTNYFSDNGARTVPVVEIEGQPSELTWEERPDVDAIGMISELIEAGDALEPGDDILLFTSGKGEIETLIKKGRAAGLQVEFTRLHSRMSHLEQARAIAPHPDTVRVIVATDVAMTSLTFPNVKYVIDEGIVKNPELDEEGTEGLVTQICSQAEIRQRGGRAGRVRPGVHILVRPHEETGQPFVSLELRSEYPVPPIYATDLSRNVLQFSNYGLDFSKLDLIDPVSSHSIRQAKDKLYNLGAIDEDEIVTDVGRLMNKFPIGTEYARMISEAMRPGMPRNVLVSTTLIACAYEAGGLRNFTTKYEAGKEPWRRIVGDVKDDSMLELTMFRVAGVESDEAQWKKLEQEGYDPKNLMRARKAYRKCMRAVGLDPFSTPIIIPDDDETAMIRHCVASGLVENIYTRSQTAQRNGKYKFYPSTGFGLPREASSRSVIDPHHVKAVVGAPRFYMAKGKNGWDKYDIIENNQRITAEELANLDLRETLVSIDTITQGGMIKVVKQRRAGQIIRGNEITVPESGELDEGVILKAVLENPGPSQVELKRIKRELEQLQNLTRRTVNQLSQVRYENLLLQAVRRSGSTEFHEIDAMLGVIMREQGVMIDTLIAPDFARQIRDAAVDAIEIDGVAIGLSYQSGKPIAKHTSAQEIEKLSDHISIPDGREVLFTVPKVSRREGKLVKGTQNLPAHEAKRVVSKLRELNPYN